MAEVSIIVPVYQVEKYIRQCVDSILGQTFTDFELILVDDGSTDRSGEICDEYAGMDERVVVIHKENGGVSSARNAGIEAATGEYICFVDSDDWLAVDAIQNFVQRIQRDHSDFCMGESRCVGLRGSAQMQKLQKKCYEKEELYKLVDFESSLRSPWAKLFKLEVIKKHNLRFIPGIAYGEDTIFVWDYLSHCERISMMDSVVYCYSVLNPENASSKYYRQLADWQYLVIEMMEKTISRCTLST